MNFAEAFSTTKRRPADERYAFAAAVSPPAILGAAHTPGVVLHRPDDLSLPDQRLRNGARRRKDKGRPQASRYAARNYQDLSGRRHAAGRQPIRADRNRLSASS